MDPARKPHMLFLPPLCNCALLSRGKEKAPLVSLQPQSTMRSDSGIWASKGKRKMCDAEYAPESMVPYKKLFLTSEAVPPMVVALEPVEDFVGPSVNDPIVNIVTKSKNALAAFRRSQTRHHKMQKAIWAAERGRAVDPFISFL